MSIRVLFLALGTFAIGTEGYVLAGLLPSVARDLHTTIAACGQLVTVFALAYAIGGPLLVAWSGHLPRKGLLIFALLGFAVANLAAAMATSYAMLVAARLLAAFTAPLYTAPSVAAAIALTRPEHKSRALSVTVTGNALSLAAGAPLGTAIGAAYGWRWAFVLVAALAVVAAVSLFLVLPSVPKPPAVAYSTRFRLLKRADVRGALATSLGLAVAALTGYTYLTPLANAAAGMHSGGVAVFMMIFGATATATGMLSGALLIRFSSRQVLSASLAALSGLLLVIAVFALTGAKGGAIKLAMFALAAVWGAAWWSAGIAQQHRLTSLVPNQYGDILALHYSLQFLGVALGGAIGGIALTLWGPTGVAVCAALIAGLTVCSVTENKSIDQPQADVAPVSDLDCLG